MTTQHYITSQPRDAKRNITATYAAGMRTGGSYDKPHVAPVTVIDYGRGGPREDISPRALHSDVQLALAIQNAEHAVLVAVGNPRAHKRATAALAELRTEHAMRTAQRRCLPATRKGEPPVAPPTAAAVAVLVGHEWRAQVLGMFARHTAAGRDALAPASRARPKAATTAPKGRARPVATSKAKALSPVITMRNGAGFKVRGGDGKVYARKANAERAAARKVK
jgi:hypothetical protein